MFADDTLIYTNATDDFKILEHIIETFCTASTAKFNKEKTEYLPIGPPEFREKVIRTRSINESWKIPDNIKIIKEGEAMRTLGTWVGNGINTPTMRENTRASEKNHGSMEKLKTII